jgi:hypothetical protein
MAKDKKAELSAYIDGLKFSLKDIQKTRAKHGDYKDEQFKELIADNSEEIADYLAELKDEVLTSLKGGISFYSGLQLTSKSDIRNLKTFVNSKTRELNTAFIKGLCDSDENDNTINHFAIKFYLQFYDEINNIMHDVIKARFEDVTGGD